MNLYKKTEVVKKYVCVLNHGAEVVCKSTLGCVLQVTHRSNQYVINIYIFLIKKHRFY